MGTQAGKPYYFALLPSYQPRDLIIERFWDICQVLTSAQAAGMMRALDRSPKSFRAYKYRRRIPRLDEMLRVIKWHEDGLEMTTRKVTESYIDIH